MYANYPGHCLASGWSSVKTVTVGLHISCRLIPCCLPLALIAGQPPPPLGLLVLPNVLCYLSVSSTSELLEAGTVSFGSGSLSASGPGF